MRISVKNILNWTPARFTDMLTIDLLEPGSEAAVLLVETSFRFGSGRECNHVCKLAKTPKMTCWEYLMRKRPRGQM